MFKYILVACLVLSFPDLFAQDPDFTPQFNSSSVPVSENHKDFNSYYIITAFGSAIFFLASTCLWLVKVVFNEKSKAVEREIKRSEQSREEIRLNETTVKDLLIAINTSIKNINESLSEVKSSNKSIQDNLSSMLDKVRDIVSHAVESIEKLIDRILKK